MPQCVGTTVTKGTQCRMGAPYRCPQCDAHLCTNHLEWARDLSGPHCPWCHVVMDQRYFDGWAPWGQGRVKSVGRGKYQIGEAGKAYLKERELENVDR